MGVQVSRFRAADNRDLNTTVQELRVLYQSMMDHLAEVTLLFSHLHARGPAQVDFEKLMPRILEEIRQVEHFAIGMRLKLKDLEKRGPPPRAG